MNKLIVLSVSVILFAAASVAETNQDDVVVTATRSPRETVSVPASVTVIGNDAVRNTAAWNLDELLRPTPGVFVLRSVGMGAGLPSQINIRGVPGQQGTLILLDGLPLNEASSGFVSVNDVPLQAVDRIEVVRGPFSALYGTHAFAGVINVLTRNPEDRPSVETRIRLGGEGFQQYTLSGAVGTRARGMTVDFDHRSTDNYLGRDDVTISQWDSSSGSFVDITRDAENYDYEDQRILFRAMTDIGPYANLELYGRFLDSELGYGQTLTGQLYPFPVDDTIKIAGRTGGARLTASPSEMTHFRGALTYRNHQRTTETLNLSNMQGSIPVYVPTEQTTESIDWRLDTGLDMEMANSHVVTVGADANLTDTDFSALESQATGVAVPLSSSADETVHNVGLYVQDDWALAGDLAIISGFRADSHSEFGKEYSPKLAARKKVTEDTILRVSAGQAFRAPTPLELFQPATQFGSVTYVSNPDLDSETVISGDMGLEHKFSERVSAVLNAFYNDMDQLITKRVQGATLSYDNIGRAWSAGVEAILVWTPVDGVSASFNYTGQQTEDRDTGEDLEHVPDHSGGLRLGVEQRTGKWLAELSLVENYIGDRGYYEFTTGAWIDLDEYWRTDVSLKVTYSDSVWLGLAVENATDEEYQEWPLVSQAPSRLYAFEAGCRW